MEKKAKKELNNINYTLSKGYWNNEENEKFKQALFLFGDEWKSIQQFISSRSLSQCKSHSQKFFNKLENKFFKDLYLIKRKNQSETTYALDWIKKIIQNMFLPSIDKIKSRNELTNALKTNNLHKLLVKKILKKKIKYFKDNQRICMVTQNNCDEIINNFTSENDSQTILEKGETEVNVGVRQKEDKVPIFKIAKIRFAKRKRKIQKMKYNSNNIIYKNDNSDNYCGDEVIEDNELLNIFPPFNFEKSFDNNTSINEEILFHVNDNYYIPNEYNNIDVNSNENSTQFVNTFNTFLSNNYIFLSKHPEYDNLFFPNYNRHECYYQGISKNEFDQEKYFKNFFN